MGNIEASLKKSDLLLEKSKGDVHDDWNVSSGRLHGTPVTVFSAIHPPSSRKRAFMEKALQASKIYRHPSILRFMDGGIIDKEVVVVTEAASPLLLYGIEQMSALQITAGLASIIDALVFLHDKAGVSHNNICSSSIYVTSDGTWKLWGLEYLCSFGDLTRDHIEKINQYCSERNLPPDDKTRISPAYQHSRDCYCLAKFFEDTIAPLLAVDIPFIEEFSLFIKSKAMHSEWSERPRLITFLAQPLFNHEFLQLRQNISNILLMSSTERDEFINGLPEALQKYPDDVVALAYGSLLLNHSFIIIPTTAKRLMPSLLIPKNSAGDNNGLFSIPVFKESIIPNILNLFQVRDAMVRKILLEHFQHYAVLISNEDLKKVLLPELLLGIRDTDEGLVAATLHCLAYLVPILGADIVVGKHREQIFTTTKPKSDLNDKGKNGKRKKRKDLEAIINKETTVCHDTKNIDIKLPDLSTAAEICLAIPERSSPDGGEVSDEDVFVGNRFDLVEESKKEDEHWSDWEEMLDQPPPEIIGILQVKTPERGSLSLEDFSDKNKDSFDSDSDNKDVRNNSESDLLQSIRKSMPSHSNNSTSEAIGFAMQLKTKSMLIKPISQGLGEEYDIMSIKVEKKPDSELDLFADLMPQLAVKNFDLESMLIEASHKSSSREKLPSLSYALAELHSQGDEEGDGWNEEEEWGESAGLDDVIPLDSSKLLVKSEEFPVNNSVQECTSNYTTIQKPPEDVDASIKLKESSSISDTDWSKDNWNNSF